MPVTGRKPKPLGQAVNRHRPTHDWVEVANVPFNGAPKLASRRANGRAWGARAKSTWQAWSAMPHCVLWMPADWNFALQTLEISALVDDGETRWATELRNRERVMGTTVDFRRDLRIRYVEPAGEQLASVTSIESARDL